MSHLWHYGSIQEHPELSSSLCYEPKTEKKREWEPDGSSFERQHKASKPRVTFLGGISMFYL
jgi:hypothetical protein